MKEYIKAVRAGEENPSVGLPDDVFSFVLQVTPMINVDLLICDPEKGILLAWREDQWDSGWHIPGGIIRHREALHHRIDEVARLELGATVSAENRPCDLVEFTDSARGHFISLLYRCTLTSRLRQSERENSPGPIPFELRWFNSAPADLYPAHDVYRRWWQDAVR